MPRATGATGATGSRVTLHLFGIVGAAALDASGGAKLTLVQTA